MVGPVSDRERRDSWRRLLIGFVIFVGISSALTALWGGATPVEVAAIGLGGVTVGTIILVAMGVRP